MLDVAWCRGVDHRASDWPWSDVWSGEWLPYDPWMICYVTLGTNDYQRAQDFYEEVMNTLGARRLFSTERMTHWGTGGVGSLAVVKPYDEQPASSGNGTMVALNADSRERVNKVYDKALALGATCEGEPGVRQGIWAAYFRDLDGNKICVICLRPAQES